MAFVFMRGFRSTNLARCFISLSASTTAYAKTNVATNMTIIPQDICHNDQRRKAPSYFMSTNSTLVKQNDADWTFTAPKWLCKQTAHPSCSSCLSTSPKQAEISLHRSLASFAVSGFELPCRLRHFRYS